MTVSLRTTYLGFDLRSPIVASAALSSLLVMPHPPARTRGRLGRTRNVPDGRNADTLRARQAVFGRFPTPSGDKSDTKRAKDVTKPSQRLKKRFIQGWS